MASAVCSQSPEGEFFRWGSLNAYLQTEPRSSFGGISLTAGAAALLAGGGSGGKALVRAQVRPSLLL